MIGQDITYTDFSDKEVTEKFWFHIPLGDLMEMAANEAFLARMQKVSSGKASMGEIMEAFKEVISKSVGRRSEDGKSFLRSQQITSEFINSNAFDSLLLEMLLNPEQAGEFVNGIMPKEYASMMGRLSNEVKDKKTKKEKKKSKVAQSSETIPFPGLEGTGVQITNATQEDRDPLDWRSYSDKELFELDSDFFNVIAGPIKSGVDPRLLKIAMRRRMAGK